MTAHRVVFLPSGKRGEFAEGRACSPRRARSASISIRSAAAAASAGAARSRWPRANSPSIAISSNAAHASPWNEVEERYASKRGPFAPGTAARLPGEDLRASSSSTCRPESQVHRQVVRKRAEEHPIDIDPVVRLHYVEVASPTCTIPRATSAACSRRSKPMGRRGRSRRSRDARGPAEDAARGRLDRHGRAAQGPRHRRGHGPASRSAPMASRSTSARPRSQRISAISSAARLSPRSVR